MSGVPSILLLSGSSALLDVKRIELAVDIINSKQSLSLSSKI